MVTIAMYYSIVGYLLNTAEKHNGQNFEHNRPGPNSYNYNDIDLIYNCMKPFGLPIATYIQCTLSTSLLVNINYAIVQV